MNSIFVTNIVPMGDVKKYRGSQAGTNFNLNIVGTGFFSKVISVPPINVDNSFPNHTDNETGIEYHAIRICRHSRLGKIINSILDNIWLFRKLLHCHETNIWFYNLGPIQSFVFNFFRLFTSKKVFVLLADFNPSRNKGLSGKIVLNSISKADGIISLSARCDKINSNQIVLPGIIPERNILSGVGAFHNNKTFLLSGVLNKNTGLELALEVFKEIPNAKLVLSGTVSDDLKDKVKEYCYLYKNIEYKGFIANYNDFIDLLISVDFVLSLLDLTQPVNKYNFPSKILEALSYKKVIFSGNIFPELEGVYYISCSYSKNDIISNIKQLISSKDNEIINRCLDNSSILRERFTEQSWVKAFTKIEQNAEN